MCRACTGMGLPWDGKKSLFLCLLSEGCNDRREGPGLPSPKMQLPRELPHCACSLLSASSERRLENC